MDGQETTAAMVMGLVRQGLGSAGGLLVAHGYATSDQMTQIVGGLMAAGMVLWSMYQKWMAAKHTALKVAVALSTPVPGAGQ